MLGTTQAKINQTKLLKCIYVIMKLQAFNKLKALKYESLFLMDINNSLDFNFNNLKIMSTKIATT